ncbi:MAG: ATP-binding protein [Verrucomicrobiae bacterium]|nr:ATP-binding protein [Verrucomicrobiae bacterium]
MSENNSHLNQVEAFHKVVLAINSELSVENIIDLILEKAAELVGATRGSLISVDHENQHLNIVAAIGPDWTPEKQSTQLRIGQGITGKVAASGKAHLCNDTATDKSYFPLFNRVLSEMAIPVIDSDTVIGVINLDSERKNAFTEADVRMLTIFADHAVLAMRNARLYSEAEHSRLEWFQTFHNLSDGIAISRDDLIIKRCNKSFSELLELPKENIIGCTIQEILRLPLEQEPGVERFHVNEATQTPNYIEFHDSKLSRTFTLETEASTNNGHFAWLYVLRDVTNEKTMQNQLIQSEKLAALGEMIAGIAHEINNPLTTITGQAELLGILKDPGKTAAASKMILREAHRAARIVKNLLVFSRSHESEKAPVVLNELIEQTLELWNYQLRVNNIQIIKNYEPALPPILIDYYQIQQVVFNLFQNSQQAIASLQRPGTIRVKTEITPQEFVRLTLQDDGPGIQPENLKKIFNPFFTTKAVGKGTGLGLSISYGIIAAHGGHIHCDSEYGKGVVFTIELPINTGDASASLASTSENLEEVIKNLPPSRFLTIDDEPGITEFLKELIESQGHSIDVFSDGLEALKKASTEKYDIILSDIKMPNIGGVDIFKQLSEDHRKRVIFITGDYVSAGTKEFISSSGQPFVAKPFGLRELGRAITDLLNAMGSKSAIFKRPDLGLKG